MIGETDCFGGCRASTSARNTVDKVFFVRFYKYLEQMARDESGVCGLRLYVEKGNGVAQATYNMMGMDETGYVVYGVEFK